MPKLALYNRDGEQVGEIELQPFLFEAPVKKGAVYQTAVGQAGRRRRGTAATRDRSEVRGGGSRPWPQKGTGRARHGSIRSPIWVGGGVIFGPHPRKYGFTVPRKMRRAALRSVLSAKAAEGRLLVVEDLAMDEPKTKTLAKTLENLKAESGALIVTVRPELNLIKSARNIPRVKTMEARQLNVLDILSFEHLVMTRDALERVQEVFGE